MRPVEPTRTTIYPAVHPEVAAGYRAFSEEPGLHVRTINIREEGPGPISALMLFPQPADVTLCTDVWWSVETRMQFVFEYVDIYDRFP